MTGNGSGNGPGNESSYAPGNRSCNGSSNGPGNESSNGSLMDRVMDQMMYLVMDWVIIA